MAWFPRLFRSHSAPLRSTAGPPIGDSVFPAGGELRIPDARDREIETWSRCARSQQPLVVTDAGCNDPAVAKLGHPRRFCDVVVAIMLHDDPVFQLCRPSTARSSPATTVSIFALPFTILFRRPSVCFAQITFHTFFFSFFFFFFEECERKS